MGTVACHVACCAKGRLLTHSDSCQADLLFSCFERGVSFQNELRPFGIFSGGQRSN